MSNSSVSSIRTLAFTNTLFVSVTIVAITISVYFLTKSTPVSNTFSKSGTITYTLIAENGTEYGFTKLNPIKESEYNSSVANSSNDICEDKPSYIYDVDEGKGYCSSETQIIQKIFVDNYKDISVKDVAVINFIRNGSKTLVPSIAEVGGYMFLSPKLPNIEDESGSIREIEIYEGSSIPIRMEQNIREWKVDEEYTIDDSKRKGQVIYIDKYNHKLFYMSGKDPSHPKKPSYDKVKSIKKRRIKSQ